MACGIQPPRWSDAKQLVENLQTSPLLTPGGCLASLYVSNQQWDAPNIWPPLQCLTIEGLENLEDAFPGCGAQHLAQEIATRFLTTAYAGFQRNGCMFEKYSAESYGRPGDGGEYKTQTGFAWTNGAVLWLLSSPHRHRFKIESDQ